MCLCGRVVCTLTSLRKQNKNCAVVSDACEVGQEEMESTGILQGQVYV